jgi:hypothetical protein
LKDIFLQICIQPQARQQQVYNQMAALKYTTIRTAYTNSNLLQYLANLSLNFITARYSKKATKILRIGYSLSQNAFARFDIVPGELLHIRLFCSLTYFGKLSSNLYHCAVIEFFS